MRDLETGRRLPVLLDRVSKLDDLHRGYVDGYVLATIEALATGLEIVERMQADKRQRQALRSVPARPHLRVVAGKPHV